MLWRLQVDAVGHAQLAALLLRSPSYKANTAVPAQHTLPERFALLISAFKPVAELGSVSDTAMSAVVARVNACYFVAGQLFWRHWQRRRRK